MNLYECVVALVNDEEFFVEISDLEFAIQNDEGQKFYDGLDPHAIVPNRPIDEKEWAIVEEEQGYGYDYIDNVWDVDDDDIVLTLSMLLPELEQHPYDHFKTREDLAEYIYPIAVG